MSHKCSTQAQRESRVPFLKTSPCDNSWPSTAHRPCDSRLIEDPAQRRRHVQQPRYRLERIANSEKLVVGDKELIRPKSECRFLEHVSEHADVSRR